MNIRALLLAFGFVSTIACAALPPQVVRLDIQASQRPFNLRTAAGTAPLIRAQILNNGSNYVVDGWTGSIYYATSATATQVVAIPVTSIQSNLVDFQVEASKIAATGSFFAQVMLSDGTNTVEWSRGTLVVLASPGSQGAAQTNWGPVLNWDLISGYMGTAPAIPVSATNEADPVASPLATNALAAAVRAQLAATNADIKAAAAASSATNRPGYQDARGFTNTGGAAISKPLRLGGSGDFGQLQLVDEDFGTTNTFSSTEDQPRWESTGGVTRILTTRYASNLTTKLTWAGGYISCPDALLFSYIDETAQIELDSGSITFRGNMGGNGVNLTNVNASTLGGIPAGSYALVSSFGNAGRYTNFPATATSAGAAGQWAVTNVGSTNWLAVWGANFQGTGTNGWGFVQLQRARP